MNRKKLAFRSSFIILIIQIVGAFISFISRKIVLVNLGLEILGANSTLVEIVGMMALTELGFAGAINCRLYKPLAENDHDRISELIYFFKRIYQLVGCAIVLLGIIGLPFVYRMVNAENVERGVINSAYVI